MRDLIRAGLGVVLFLVWLFLIVTPRGSLHLGLNDPVINSLLPLVLAVPGFFVGLVLFFRGFSLLSRERLIQNTPTSKIRGAAIGLVEVCGTITGPYTLISPLGEVDCHYYKAVALRQEGSGENKRWKKAAEETLCTPFFIEDNTGRLMVDPRGAETDLPREVDEEGSTATMPEYMHRFLRRHGISDHDYVRLEEYCIKPGDTLFVLGTLGESSAGMTDSQRGEGLLSAEAADLQRRSALEDMNVPPCDVPAPSAQAKSAFDLSPPVLLGRGIEHQPFFVSRHSQRDVLTQLAWKSTLYIWGGPVLMLVSVGVLINWLGWW